MKLATLRSIRRRRSLVDLVADAITRDPGDAPVVQLEADVMADEMERYAPTAAEPTATSARVGATG